MRSIIFLFMLTNVALADYTADEITATCLVMEAGGEGIAGMHAVMNVIQNRANEDYFYLVVVKPKQFSCFNEGDMQSLIDRAKRHPRWGGALELVDKARSGVLPDKTKGSTHYCTISVFYARVGIAFNVQIGEHIFFTI